LREGYNSLAVFYVNIVLELLSDDYAKETLDVLLFLLYEVVEFDTPFVINKYYELTKLYRNEMISDMFITKLRYLRGEVIKYDQSVDAYKNIYYTVSMRYFHLASKLKNGNSGLELEILEFREFCKSKSINKFKLLANILISKLYCSQNKLTESLYILEKNISKSRDYYIKLKSKIAMLTIYEKNKMNKNIEEVLKELASTIEIFGTIEDKYEYYIIEGQYNSNTKGGKSASIRSVKNAIHICNLTKIKHSSIVCMLNQTNIDSSIKELIDLHEKLFKIKDLITLKDNEEIELYKIIHYASNKIASTI
jgi:hypothetical protein